MMHVEFWIPLVALEVLEVPQPADPQFIIVTLTRSSKGTTGTKSGDMDSISTLVGEALSPSPVWTESNIYGQQNKNKFVFRTLRIYMLLQ